MEDLFLSGQHFGLYEMLGQGVIGGFSVEKG